MPRLSRAAALALLLAALLAVQPCAAARGLRSEGSGSTAPGPVPSPPRTTRLFALIASLLDDATITADAVATPSPPPSPSSPSPSPSPAATPLTPVSAECLGQPYSSYVRINGGDTLGLQAAFDASTPGTLIELLPGTYDRTPFWNLTIFNRQGDPASPITVCGPRAAVITGAGGYGTNGVENSRPYVLLIRQSANVRVTGFTLVRGYKGLMVEASTGVVASGLAVDDIDFEGIRVRYDSSDVTIQGCQVTNTGQTSPGTGEGVYIGSSYQQDASDYTTNVRILNNAVGPGVTAECIDIKENTSGGLVQGNRFDGSGLLGANYADSWVDVKGTGWTIIGNVGFNTNNDGFQTHQRPGQPQSGFYNTFAGNTCNLGGAPGECITIQCKGRNLGLCGNRVTCDNVVSGGSGVLSNLGCS